jgi:hypothetical protein
MEIGLTLNILYTEGINILYPDFRVQEYTNTRQNEKSKPKPLYLYGVIFYGFIVLTEVLLRRTKEIWTCMSSERIHGLRVLCELKLELDLIKADLYLTVCHMIVCHIGTFHVSKEQCKINLQRRGILNMVIQFLHKSRKEFIAIYVVNKTL